MNYVLGRPGMLSEIRRCAVCQSTKTGVQHRLGIVDTSLWYHKPEGWLCDRCYDRIYRTPRRMEFTPTGKMYTFKEHLRTGTCSRCFRSKARGEIKKTAMHHTSYDATDILANTVELCVRCHKQLHPGTYPKTRRARRSP